MQSLYNYDILFNILLQLDSYTLKTFEMTHKSSKLLIQNILNDPYFLSLKEQQLEIYKNQLKFNVLSLTINMATLNDTLSNGVFINANTILTLGENLYNIESHKALQKATSDNYPLILDSMNIPIPFYKKTPNYQEYNFGVLFLKNNIDVIPLDLQLFKKNELVNLFMYCYPAHFDPLKGLAAKDLVEHQLNVINITHDEIFYQPFYDSGTAGAPIFMKDKYGIYLVGLHYGYATSNKSVGIRVTPKMIEFVDKNLNR